MWTYYLNYRSKCFSLFPAVRACGYYFFQVNVSISLTSLSCDLGWQGSSLKLKLVPLFMLFITWRCNLRLCSGFRLNKNNIRPPYHTLIKLLTVEPGRNISLLEQQWWCSISQPRGRFANGNNEINCAGRCGGAIVLKRLLNFHQLYAPFLITPAYHALIPVFSLAIFSCMAIVCLLKWRHCLSSCWE